MFYYLSHIMLSWVTLSFAECWLRSRKGTCHLPIFLLCVSIVLLATKISSLSITYSGYCIHVHQIISIHTTAQNLHSEPIHPRKVYSNMHSLSIFVGCHMYRHEPIHPRKPSQYPLATMRIWVILKKARQKGDKTHISPQFHNFWESRDENKKTKISQVWVHALPLPWTSYLP
jgi:hypothetical protein